MKKVEDIVFTVPMYWNRGDDIQLEIFVAHTNEINPHRETRELGIVIYEKDENLRKSDQYRQLDNSNEFGVEEIEKLIKYLNKVKKHIKKFNDNSKPEEVKTELEKL